MIYWRSNDFPGYTPEERCEAISPRFQKAEDNGTLSKLTYGKINNQPVICSVKEIGNKCSQNGTLLLTLRPEDDPEIVLATLVDSLISSNPMHQSAGLIEETEEGIYVDSRKAAKAQRTAIRKRCAITDIWYCNMFILSFIFLTNPSFPPETPTQESPILAQSIQEQPLSGEVKKIEEIAAKITVAIKGAENGSGVIIAREGSTYYVLTAEHVLDEKGEYKVITEDGKEYTLKKIDLFVEVDLAVGSFQSQEDYDIATLADYHIELNSRQAVFVYGWAGGTERRFSPGLVYNKTVGNQFSQNTPISLEYVENGGYELVYTNITVHGMSGGAILDSSGRVIGIHAAAEIVREGLRNYNIGYSFGVPIDKFLAQQSKAGGKFGTLKVVSDLPKELSEEVIEDLFAVEVPSENGSAQDWINYGNQLWRFLRYEEAVEAFDRAIKLKEDLYLAHYGKGLALLSQRQFTEAAFSFILVTKLKESFYPALEKLSLIHLHKC